jgi:uncharacterized protein YndB with AHSA1/START domain
MHSATESIQVRATPEQSWQVLTNLQRLPEWYTPAQQIKVLSAGPVGEGWQFILTVKTWSGVALEALGTVKEFDPGQKVITWRGQATGIAGDSRWQIVPTTNGHTQIQHTFQGQGWLMFLSQKLGRNRMTVQKRLLNLKRLIESEYRFTV